MVVASLAMLQTVGYDAAKEPVARIPQQRMGRLIPVARLASLNM